MRNNALTLSFVSFAPGKVIISGEHSVVYGKSALCFSIDKYTKAKFYLRYNNIITNNNIFCTVKLKELKREFDITKNEILNAIKKEQFIDYSIKDEKIILISIFKNVFGFIDFKEQLYDFINKSDNFIIEICSDIHIGYGLGSSAAFNVSLVNGLAFLIEKVFNVHLDINDNIHLANKGEKFFHKTPSGCDVTSSFKGGIVLFNSIENYQSIFDYSLFESFCIYLLSTEMKRETKQLLAKSSVFKKENPNKFNEYINRMGDITLLIKDIIHSQDEIGKQQFLELIKENQMLLKNIMVSNDVIDLIVSRLNENGFYAKITGAGGGGYILVIIKKEEKDKFMIICEKYNYIVTQVKIVNQGAFIKSY